MRNKITVDLSPEDAEFIEHLKSLHGTPYSYTVRRALRMLRESLR